MALPIMVWENQGANPDINAWAATDTDPGSQYHVDNLLDFRPFTRWKAASSGEKFITGDWTTVPGGNITVDCFAIIGHNLATVAADIYLEQYVGTWVDAGAGKINATADDEIILGLLPTPKTDDSFRLRLDATTAAAEIGVFLLGERLEFPRHLDGAWDPEGQRIEADQPVSKGGEKLGSTIRYLEHNLTPQWNRLTETWIRNTFMPIWRSHLAQLNGFVFAWDPSGAHLADLRYMSLTPGTRLQVPYDQTRQSLSLPMRGIVRP